jgi:polyferredoxin
MTGKLHLPIPMMITAGPVYRLEISFMPVLFISTILVSGPAWCSQLCYFGAFDNLASKGKTTRQVIQNKALIKTTILVTVIATAIVLRLFSVPLLTSTILAGAFGIIGLLIILFITTRKKKMVHCILWCPVGTLVNLFKYVNPFRMYIDKSCTLCMHCTSYCKYDALNRSDIEKGIPGLTCTLCGDCLAGCSHNSIKYRFLRLSPEASRNLWIVITVSLHGVFLALGRI